MILNKSQIRNRYDWKERVRRSNSEETDVQSLKTPEIKTLLKRFFSKEELRAELKRRKERLRYMKIMANPKTRSEYRARKRAEYAARTSLGKTLGRH